MFFIQMNFSLSLQCFSYKCPTGIGLFFYYLYYFDYYLYYYLYYFNYYFIINFIYIYYSVSLFLYFLLYLLSLLLLLLLSLLLFIRYLMICEDTLVIVSSLSVIVNGLHNQQTLTLPP